MLPRRHPPSVLCLEVNIESSSASCKDCKQLWRDGAAGWGRSGWHRRQFRRPGGMPGHRARLPPSPTLWAWRLQPKLLSPDLLEARTALHLRVSNPSLAVPVATTPGLPLQPDRAEVMSLPIQGGAPATGTACASVVEGLAEATEATGESACAGTSSARPATPGSQCSVGWRSGSTAAASRAAA
jgi:hypothetical protein